MFCTSIIPTVGRDTLRRAVQSVLEQNFSKDSYEVIVVNDSGAPLPADDWQQSPLVRVVDTNHRERCVARNVGAALAQGKYLHFLDDDDWLLPGALESFWRLSRQYSDGAWLYGGAVIFNREDQPVIDLIHHLGPNCFVKVMAGEWIPLQASFINQACFHKIEGFNPLIPGIEDVDLARRMALHFDFHGISDLVAGVGLGVERSTTNQAKARLDGRQARELILNESGVYQRLWQSADNAYWHGRIVRVYLTSAAWNLSRRRFVTTVSRVSYGMVAMLEAVFGSLFNKDFWRAILGPYESEAFARGQAERQKRVVGVSE
jgi:glycosyltransferase involved in cell wall biosynthesis